MTILSHPAVADFDAVTGLWVVLALRALWLLPDWLGKWQWLMRHRRPAAAEAGHRSDVAR